MPSWSTSSPTGSDKSGAFGCGLGTAVWSVKPLARETAGKVEVPAPLSCCFNEELQRRGRMLWLVEGLAAQRLVV